MRFGARRDARSDLDRAKEELQKVKVALADLITSRKSVEVAKVRLQSGMVTAKSQRDLEKVDQLTKHQKILDEQIAKLLEQEGPLEARMRELETNTLRLQVQDTIKRSQRLKR